MGRSEDAEGRQGLALGPAQRLTGDAFVRAVRTRPQASTAHLRVHARPNGLGTSRIGVSVGRAFGRAAERNRLKRLVRESFRTDRALREAGLDIVVVARDRAVLERPEEVGAALAEAARTSPPGRGAQGTRGAQ